MNHDDFLPDDERRQIRRAIRDGLPIRSDRMTRGEWCSLAMDVIQAACAFKNVREQNAPRHIVRCAKDLLVLCVHRFVSADSLLQHIRPAELEREFDISSRAILQCARKVIAARDAGDGGAMYAAVCRMDELTTRLQSERENTYCEGELPAEY